MTPSHVRFRLPEEAWQELCRLLDRIGRHPSEGDRHSLELICDAFVRGRIAAGRKLVPRPKALSEQWARARDAAKALEDAIAEIEATPDAADLSLLEWNGASAMVMVADPVLPAVAIQGVSDAGTFAVAAFRDQLRQFVARAHRNFDLEAAAPAGKSKEDLELNWLVVALVSKWTAWGGQLKSSVDQHGEADGPAVRFLYVVLNSALAAASLRPRTKGAVREIIRKHQADPRN